MIDIRDFDGWSSTNPTLAGDAINRALLEAASTWAVTQDWKGELLPDTPRGVVVPGGAQIKVDQPLIVSSRAKLCGETRGASHIIQVEPDLPLIEIVSPQVIPDYVVDVEICGLGLQSNGTGPIITYRNVPGNQRTVVIFNLHDLHLAGKYHMIFDTDADEVYVQHARIERVLCTGQIEQMLRMGGNNVFVRGLEKGIATGHSDEPYIHIKGHRDGQTGVINRNYNILLDEVLVQQHSSPNKAAIKLERVEGVLLSNSWTELSNIKHDLHLVQAENVRVLNTNFNTNKAGMIKLENNSTLYVDTHQDGGLDVFDVDDTSFAHIDNYCPYHGKEVQGKKNLTVGKAFATSIYRANPASKYSPDVTAEVFDSILPDQYFDDGLGSWTWLVNANPQPDTQSFKASPFGRGQVLHAEWDASVAGLLFLRQQFLVTDDMVGLTATVTVRGRATGSGSKWILPQFFGGGTPMNSGAVHIANETGWQVSTLRVPITDSGVRNVGVGLMNPEPGVTYEIAEIALKID